MEAERAQRVADRFQAEVTESHRRMEEQKNELLDIISTPPATMSVPEYGAVSGGGLELEEDTMSHMGSDLEVLITKEFDYTSQMNKNTRLRDQLRKLGTELNKSRVSSRMSVEDILHESNIVSGRDKYETLRQIRKGNTRERVDNFELL